MLDDQEEAHDFSLIRELPAGADPGPLREAETLIGQTTAKLVVNRADLYLRDRLQEEAWAVFAEWAAGRSLADAGLPLEHVGRWAFSTRERLWLDAGMVHPQLIRELPTAEELTNSLSTVFRPGVPGVKIVPLSTYYLERYRSLLQVEERLEQQGAWASCEQVMRSTRARIEAVLLERRQLLAKVVSDMVPIAVHALDQLLPHLARITWLNRDGGLRDPRSRRAQMKAVARARRLTHAVLQGIPVYRNRKHFETLQAELLKLQVVVLETENQSRELSASRASPVGSQDPTVEVDECREASLQAVASVQRLLRTVSRTPTFCLPPFVLEHMPRVTSDVIAGKLAKICTLCPRVERSLEKASAVDLRILLLPGIGHPMYSTETQEVLTPLYTLESNLHALTGVIGQAILKADRSLNESYAHYRRTEADSEKALLDLFHRDFVAWVENDWRAKQANDRKTQRWFRDNLVDRFLRARSS